MLRILNENFKEWLDTKIGSGNTDASTICAADDNDCATNVATYNTILSAARSNYQNFAEEQFLASDIDFNIILKDAASETIANYDLVRKSLVNTLAAVRTKYRSIFAIYFSDVAITEASTEFILNELVEKMNAVLKTFADFRWVRDSAKGLDLPAGIARIRELLGEQARLEDLELYLSYLGQEKFDKDTEYVQFVRRLEPKCKTEHAPHSNDGSRGPIQIPQASWYDCRTGLHISIKEGKVDSAKESHTEYNAEWFPAQFVTEYENKFGDDSFASLGTVYTAAAEGNKLEDVMPSDRWTAPSMSFCYSREDEAVTEMYISDSGNLFFEMNKKKAAFALVRMKLYITAAKSPVASDAAEEGDDDAPMALKFKLPGEMADFGVSRFNDALAQEYKPWFMRPFTFNLKKRGSGNGLIETQKTIMGETLAGAMHELGEMLFVEETCVWNKKKYEKRIKRFLHLGFAHFLTEAAHKSARSTDATEIPKDIIPDVEGVENAGCYMYTQHALISLMDLEGATFTYPGEQLGAGVMPSPALAFKRSRSGGSGGSGWVLSRSVAWHSLHLGEPDKDAFLYSLARIEQFVFHSEDECRKQHEVRNWDHFRRILNDFAKRAIELVDALSANPGETQDSENTLEWILRSPLSTQVGKKSIERFCNEIRDNAGRTAVYTQGKMF